VATRSRTDEEFTEYARRYLPLSLEEEDTLIRRVVAGEEGTLELLLKHNAAKVLQFALEAYYGVNRRGNPSIWSRYAHGVLPLDDCIMLAAEAFIHAARTFDPNRYSPVAKARVRFRSWANFIIRRELANALKRAAKKRDDPMDDTVLPPQSGADPEVEVARLLFWERVDELLSPEDAANLREFLNKQPAKTAGKVRSAGLEAIKRLKEKMPEHELRHYAKMLC